MESGLDNQVMMVLDNVSLGYEGRAVIENISFSLLRGENLCLVGANGSGKSTLIKGILGLIPAQKGTIDVKCGLNRVSYLAQIHATDRDFPATVREIVLSGTQVSGRRLPFYTKRDKAQAAEAMAASSSACSWPGPSRASRSCSSWTSPARRWIRRSRRRCTACSISSSASWG